MTKEALSAGAFLAHYRIASRIGEGGMGEVYLAEDTKLDRKVALKILPSRFADDEARLGRFVQEAKAASALNHPNIITVYEIGEAGGIHYIAGEFIDGRTLRQWMATERPKLPVQIEIALQAANALAAGACRRNSPSRHQAGKCNGKVRRAGQSPRLRFGEADSDISPHGYERADCA